MPNFRQAVQFNGIAPLGLVASVVSTTGNYTLGVNDALILGNASGGAFTLTLPSAAAAGATGRMYTLKKTDSSANAVTIATTASQTIDGASTYTLTGQNQYVAVTSDGTNWQVIDGNLLFDTTATDIQALGTQAAGSSGQMADAKHVHPMPRHDQLLAPTASVSWNSQKITSLANGSAATDAAALGQVAQTANNLSDLASASTARTNLGLGTAATQASTAFDAAGAATAAAAYFLRVFAV